MATAVRSDGVSFVGLAVIPSRRILSDIACSPLHKPRNQALAPEAVRTRGVWQMSGSPKHGSPKNGPGGRERRRPPPNKRMLRAVPVKSTDGESGPDVALTDGERLQKVLSRLGVASRRKAEEMIAEGRVNVNGERVRRVGTSVNVWKDRIDVDGKRVQMAGRAVWLALHKPRGYVSSLAAAVGARGLGRFVDTGHTGMLVVVGAVEEDGSGLVLLTNERGAVPELIKNDNAHVKIWHVDCKGMITNLQMSTLNKGVVLEDDAGPAVSADVEVIGSGKMEITSKERGFVTRLEFRLRDSRHHVVRRMCESVGLSVVRLTQLAFGPVLLGGLRQGETRGLTSKEMKAVKRGVGASPDEGAKPFRRRR